MWRAGVVCVALLLASPGTAATQPWHPHIAAARRYARRRAGEVVFATIDQRGRFRGYHVRETAPMASTFKVMLLASLLRKRADHPLSRRDRQLLAPMIRRSDNVAATTVRDMVGPRRIRRLARVAGMRDFEYNPVWGLSRSSPRDEVRFMYHPQRYIPGRHRAFACSSGGANGSPSPSSPSSTLTMPTASRRCVAWHRGCLRA